MRQRTYRPQNPPREDASDGEESLDRFDELLDQTVRHLRGLWAISKEMRTYGHREDD